MRTKNRTKPSVLATLTAALPAALLLSACATAPAESAREAEPSPEQQVVEQGPDQDIIDQYGGDGMLMPLDGSSLEAFETSLAKVKRNSESSAYETLENAIAYLLFYDLAARGDREKLAANLDGLTGYEVIKKVSWRQPRNLQEGNSGR
jgi:hypothetical protein